MDKLMWGRLKRANKFRSPGFCLLKHYCDHWGIFIRSPTGQGVGGDMAAICRGGTGLWLWLLLIRGSPTAKTISHSAYLTSPGIFYLFYGKYLWDLREFSEPTNEFLLMPEAMKILFFKTTFSVCSANFDIYSTLSKALPWLSSLVWAVWT